jgi:hypothetical protein
MLKVGHKIKKIEEGIEGIDNKQAKEEAKRRWAELQKKITWRNHRYLSGAIKQLQYERNHVAHPSTEKLEKQGKLKGNISFQNVNEIIDVWIISMSLHA